MKVKASFNSMTQDFYTALENAGRAKEDKTIDTGRRQRGRKKKAEQIAYERSFRFGWTMGKKRSTSRQQSEKKRSRGGT